MGKLKRIPVITRDEIGILAHSVHQMEYDVCKNMEELKYMTAEKDRTPQRA